MKAGETIGEYVVETRAPLSGASIEIAALDLVAHWSRCSLTADWLAHVAAYDFEHRDTAINVLSTVVNELLENAAKFASEKRASVRVSLHHFGDVVRVAARNVADDDGVASLRAALADIERARDDLERLFVARIERKGSSSSGLGLVILAKDYGAALGARLAAPDGDDGRWLVEVQVTLSAEEVEKR